MASFVNPYTFVPLVPRTFRTSPAGHHRMAAGSLSGVLEVTVTALTPLLIGVYAGPADKHVLPRHAKNGAVMIPGSGMIGATRSLHEALTGSCLRVLAVDRIPVHRHPVNTSYTGELKLAIVTEVTNGTATAVRLCSRWRWIPQELLPRAGGQLPRTGDRIRYQAPGQGPADFPEKALGGVTGRRTVRVKSQQHPDRLSPGEIVHVAGIGPVAGNDWVVLVTDTRARSAGTAYFVAGQIGTDARRCKVPEATWSKYLAVVDGADDLRPSAAGFPEQGKPQWNSAEPEYSGVSWPPGSGTEIARRLLARPYLHVGQPVWVMVDGNQVTELRLSELWRYRGSGSFGERVHEARPCTDAEHLCWSCRMFGSADTSGKDEDDLAVQRSYRGHVRIDDLLAVGEVKPLAWRLAPLLSPKPSAGQFYLVNPPGPANAPANSAPGASWGSHLDQGRPRAIRGRKFYWHTEHPDAGDFPRGRARQHNENDPVCQDAELIPAGTMFKGRVCFDNLSVAEYGSLLAALDPPLLHAAEPGQGWEGTAGSVGGGKPFGFGAIRTGITAARVQTAAGRYLGESEQAPSEDEALLAFRDEVPYAVRQTWHALVHALTFGFISDDLVWYPPGSEGADGEGKGSKEYDESFTFFAASNGIELETTARDLIALPDPAQNAARQVLDAKGGERQLTEAELQARRERSDRRRSERGGRRRG